MGVDRPSIRPGCAGAASDDAGGRPPRRGRPRRGPPRPRPRRPPGVVVDVLLGLVLEFVVELVLVRLVLDLVEVLVGVLVLGHEVVVDVLVLVEVVLGELAVLGVLELVVLLGRPLLLLEGFLVGLDDLAVADLAAPALELLAVDQRVHHDVTAEVLELQPGATPDRPPEIPRLLEEALRVVLHDQDDARQVRRELTERHDPVRRTLGSRRHPQNVAIGDLFADSRLPGTTRPEHLRGPDDLLVGLLIDRLDLLHEAREVGHLGPLVVGHAQRDPDVLDLVDVHELELAAAGAVATATAAAAVLVALVVVVSAAETDRPQRPCPSPSRDRS